MSKSVKFYYHNYSAHIYFIEDNKVYYIGTDGVICLSIFPPWEVVPIGFELIEEVFN